MEVTVLRATENPERLVCQAARGDYYEGYVGDTEYADLMENVNYSDDDLENLPVMTYRNNAAMLEQMNIEISAYQEEDGFLSRDTKLAAKTRSFIEKQLSRGHFGPWEHPQITFALKGVPVFTERQLIRHRHLTFDVQSMRYADFSDAPYTVPKSMTDPDHFSREQGLTDISDDAREKARALYEAEMDRSFEKYKELRELGIPKEDARGLLGLSTEVNLTVSGNARTFLHLLDMRRKANAQRNIRELSETMLVELFDWMPYTFNYYDQNGPNKLSP